MGAGNAVVFDETLGFYDWLLTTALASLVLCI